MKMINIKIYSCISIILIGLSFSLKELPRDEALEKPIIEKIGSSNSCVDFKPLIKAYLDKFKSTLVSENNKLCTFTCVNKKRFGEVINYCRQNKCDFAQFIKVLGESSKHQFFNCDVNRAKNNWKKASKVASLNLKVHECKGDDVKCFFKLVLERKVEGDNCEKFSPFLEKEMNKQAQESGYGECSVVCSKKDASERWHGLLDYLREEISGTKHKNKEYNESEVLTLLEEKKSNLENLYKETIKTIFKKSGDRALYKCNITPEKKSERKLK